MAKPRNDGKATATVEPTPDDKPFLDLNTTDKKQGYIRIDDRTYDLANVAAFSLRERRRAVWLFKRIVAIDALEEPDDKDEREYGDRLEELIGLLVPDLTGDPDTTGKLSDGQLYDIAMAFFVQNGEAINMTMLSRLLQVTSGLVKEMSGKTSLTGDGPSPASNGTTGEAIPSDG